MSVSMGAFVGLPPSLIETYGSDIKKIYKANGVPVCLGLVTMFISVFIHLMITCIVMLSGIMFPVGLLPDFLETIGRIFPASCGYRLMLDHGFCFENLWYLFFIFFAAVIVCGIVLKKQKDG